MMKRLLLFLASSTLAASASTISFAPSSQTINVGQTATVNVNVSGLTASQVVGAFDLFVDNNSSVVTPTSVTFYTDLGTDLSFSGLSLSGGSLEAYEVSNDSNATLAGLQAAEPFSLFSISYLGVGAGTSAITLGSTPGNADLSNGNGNILPLPLVDAGSITVRGGGGMAVTPEPSSLMLLGSGMGVLASGLWRRRRA